MLYAAAASSTPGTLPTGLPGAGMSVGTLAVSAVVLVILGGLVLKAYLDWRTGVQGPREERRQLERDYRALLRGEGTTADGKPVKSLPDRIDETNAKVDRGFSDLTSAIAALTTTVGDRLDTMSADFSTRLDAMAADFGTLTGRVVTLEEGQREFLATASDLEKVRLIPQMQRDLQGLADDVLQLATLTTTQHRDNTKKAATEVHLREDGTRQVVEHVDALKDDLRIALVGALQAIASNPSTEHTKPRKKEKH